MSEPPQIVVENAGPAGTTSEAELSTKRRRRKTPRRERSPNAVDSAGPGEENQDKPSPTLKKDFQLTLSAGASSPAAVGSPLTSRSAQVFTIYMPNGQLHSIIFSAKRTLMQVLQKLCEHRADLSLEKGVASDMDGNQIDISKTLGELGLSEIKFGAENSGDQPTEAQEELLLELELVNKVLSIDAANIETVDEFMQGGHLMDGDNFDTVLDDNAKPGEESFARRKLKEIAKKLHDKDTGVSIRTRKLRLRTYDLCFVASEAVKWMQEQLNVTKEEAISLGRGIEREGFIHHITYRYNFSDSANLLFRFTEDDAAAAAGSGEQLESPVAAAAAIGSVASGGSTIALAAALPKQLPNATKRKLNKFFDASDVGQGAHHNAFWAVAQDVLANAASKTKTLRKKMLQQALTSYVPNLVMRYCIQKSQVVPPVVETYPAALLFADISGFTPLAEKLARQGARGVELLTMHLNEYFGKMIDLIFDHGGDIIKFAGDALLAIWPTASEAGLPFETLLVSQCALAMQEHLHNHDADGVPLTLHIGVGAGEINGIHVGGVANRLEFLIAGHPLDQAAHCEEAAKSGEVFISHEAAMLIKEAIEVSVDKPDKKNKKKKTSLKPDAKDGIPNYRLERVTDSVPMPPSLKIPSFKQMKKCISPYIQPAVLGHLQSGQPDHFLAELRTVSVIFINLSLPYSPDKLELLQKAVCTMQEAVYSFEGTIRQFIIDDKGSVLIAAWGLPPLSHEDDPARALRASMFIQKSLKALNVGNSIGVTTGKSFCGAVGSEERREYAMVGDIVNLSARLMGKAGGSILCDTATYNASRSRIAFKTLPSILVKGKQEPIEVFTPIREVQQDSTAIRRNPEKFGSLGRAQLLKSKSSIASALLGSSRVQEEKIVGRQKELKLLYEQIDWLKTASEAQTISRPPSPMELKADSSPATPKRGSDKNRKEKLTADEKREKRASGGKSPDDGGDTSSGSRHNSDSSKRHRRKPSSQDASKLDPESADRIKKAAKEQRDKDEDSSTSSREESTSTDHVSLSTSASMNDLTSQDTEPLEAPPEPGRVVIIEGDAGFGKSVLIRKVFHYALSKQLKSLVGMTYSIEANSTYFAWRDIFSVLFDLERGDLGQSSQTRTVGDRSERVLEKLQSISPDLQELAPLLQTVLPIDIPDNEKTSQMTGQLRAEKLQSILLKVLESSDVRLFILENAHWLDSASWALVLAAAQTLKNRMFILVTRPFDPKPLEFAKLQDIPNSVKTSIGAFTGPELIELIASRLDVPTVPEELSSLLQEKGGGNPLLTSELVDALVHSGRVEVKNGEVRVQKKLTEQLSTLGIPDTLRGLITGKIDRLSQTRQMILKVASVIGRVFESALLQEIVSSLTNTPSEENTFMADLIFLEENDLISVKSEEPLSYTFKQIMTQEVVYDLMLYSQKRTLHEKVAEWIEINNDDNSAAFTVLAYHWKSAENLEKALHYFSLSGERALTNCANREAVAFFLESIEIWNKVKPKDNANSKSAKAGKSAETWRLVGWQRQLGQAYYNLGLLDKAGTHLENALALMNEPIKASESEVNALVAKLKVKGMPSPHLDAKLVKTTSVLSPTLSPTLLAADSPRPGRNSASAPDSVLGATKKKPGLSVAVQNREHILILLTLAKVNFYNCNKRVVTYCNLVALRKAEEQGVSKELIEAYGNCIITAGMHGKHDVAEAYIERGSTLAQQFSKTDSEPYNNVLQMAGMYYTGMGNWKKAEDYFQRAIKLAKEAGNFRRQEESFIFLATCYFLQGKIRKSFKTNELAVESAKRRGDIQSQVIAFTAQARNQLALGQTNKALDALKQVESFPGRAEGYKLDMSSEISYHSLLALTYMAQKDFELAYATAETVETFLSSSEPTAYFTFTGYMAVPEVFLLVAQHLSKPNATVKLRAPIKVVLDKARKALDHLTAFAHFFPCSEPRLLLWQGVVDQLSGRADKAQSKWKQSLFLAGKLEMLYEQGLAMYRIGKCTDVKDSHQVVQEKLRSVDTAVDIFTQIGAVYTELLIE